MNPGVGRWTLGANEVNPVLDDPSEECDSDAYWTVQLVSILALVPGKVLCPLDVEALVFLFGKYILYQLALSIKGICVFNGRGG